MCTYKKYMLPNWKKITKYTAQLRHVIKRKSNNNQCSSQKWHVFYSFQGVQNKELAGNVLYNYSQTSIFESLGYQTNSLINRDDTEQAMIYQKLLVKPLFYGYLNCCLAVLKHISISLAIYLYLHIFPNFFFFFFFKDLFFDHVLTQTILNIQKIIWIVLNILNNLKYSNS